MVPLTNAIITAYLLYKVFILYQKQKEESLRDPLTGLYNRRFVADYLERTLQKLSRAPTSMQEISILMIDIDDFKLVNDTYGHQIGDKVLQAVAGVLESNLRISDIAARYGGEEFLVVLPRTSEKKALHIAERIRRAVSTLSVGPVPQITVSIGLASWKEGLTPSGLLEIADQKLYQAKREGKNRVVY